MTKLRVNDDENSGTITVTLNGKTLREFWYDANDRADRRTMMERAQYYREGYGDALDHSDDDPATADPESIAVREHADAESLTAAGRGTSM